MAPLITILVNGWIMALYKLVLLNTTVTSSLDSRLFSDVLCSVLDDISVSIVIMSIEWKLTV